MLPFDLKIAGKLGAFVTGAVCRPGPFVAGRVCCRAGLSPGAFVSGTFVAERVCRRERLSRVHWSLYR